jgi:hypothetical protein
MKLDSSLDHIQFRDGTSLLGTVRNPSFTLKTNALGRLTIERDEIISIIFRSSSTGAEERVILKESTQLFGTIEDTELDFVDDALGSLSIELSKVLAIQFTF